MNFVAAHKNNLPPALQVRNILHAHPFIYSNMQAFYLQACEIFAPAQERLKYKQSLEPR